MFQTNIFGKSFEISPVIAVENAFNESAKEIFSWWLWRRNETLLRIEFRMS